MNEQFSRSERVLGADSTEKLKNARVAVFGIGGVGGYTAEALARAGVGTIDLFDFDTVEETNLNRQIIALHSTLGRKKVDVMRERIADINPKATVNAFDTFYSAENADKYDLGVYTYIADAIDSVAAKTELIVRANAAGVPIISAMGTGNKIDAAGFAVADIYKTSVCPLAKVMRRELKARGIKHHKVVFSEEEPRFFEDETEKDAESEKKRRAPGSTPFVPPVAGFIMAGEIIKYIVNL